MACDALNFSGVDESKWTCGKNLVQSEYGITINSDQGQASAKGFTLSWNYNAGQQTLELQCTDKPWWAPCGTVNGRIESTASKCGITAAADDAATSPPPGSA